MDEKTTYYNGLIAAYFSGEASPEEIELLSAWLTEDQANLKIFEAFHKAWMITGKDAIASGIDLDTEWSTITARMEPEAMASPTLLHIDGKRNKGRLAIMLTSWKAAAALAILLATAAALFYLNSGPGMVVVTADSGSLEHVLPDGSVVTLYKGSVLEYPAGMSENKRCVRLEGEAYFNIKRDENRPFIVSGSDARIEVLGTSFDVNTRAGDDKISVVLTSGKVSLYFKGRESENLVLHPGEKAVMTLSDKVITTGINPDPNYMAWKTRQITFDNTSLDQVIATLSKVYQTNIRLGNQQLSNCSLTATFNQQSFGSVLNIIKATLDVEITDENGVVVVNGPGCN